MKSNHIITTYGTIPKEWDYIPFKRILNGKIRHGIYKKKEFLGKGVKLLKMGVQYSTDRIGPQTMERAKVNNKELIRYKISKDDLIFSRTSMMSEGAGKCSIVIEHSEPIIFDGNLICATLNREIADPKFYFYFFNSIYGKQEVSNITHGTQSRNIASSHLAEIKVPYPSIEEQRIISNFLWNLDDKIEINRQMNETLETMARAIFKSWFVDFDPVRAKMEGRKPYGMDEETAALFPDELEDSELGEIPKGWEIGNFGDIAKNPRRQIKPKDVPYNTPYIGLEHMPRRSIALDNWGYVTEVKSNKYLFHQEEILFGKLRPYFHKVGIAVIDGICSTDILVVIPKSPKWFSLVLNHISSTEFVNFTTASSTGTKMPRTNWGDMKKYEIIIPPIEIAGVFNNKVSLLINDIKFNILQSRTLASIRDTLLPKLISGEIRIRDAEKFLKERGLGDKPA